MGNEIRECFFCGSELDSEEIYLVGSKKPSYACRDCDRLHEVTEIRFFGAVPLAPVNGMVFYYNKIRGVYKKLEKEENKESMPTQPVFASI